MDAERYAALLDLAVREAPLLRVPPRPDELELQAHWFAGDFGREFRATDGRRVQVVQFGVWNREAGPDFAEAAVSFDGAEAVRGSVELDIEPKDWERHGHDLNAAYENVVLHVCFSGSRQDHFTRTVGHRSVPQVRLDHHLAADTPAPDGAPAKPGRCTGPLEKLPDDMARGVLLSAARYRLQRKAAALARTSEIHGPDEALYQALATAFGYKSNKLPFTLLAQRLPLQNLLKARENGEALMFGVSGFLRGVEPADCDPPTRTYLRAIWERWWQRRAELERLTVPAEQWRLSGQRPANHPQRRLGALAECVSHWPKLRLLRESGEPKAIRDFFAQLSSDYWDHHYTLMSRPSSRPMALVGESRVVELLANVFIPFALPDRPAVIDTYVNLRAPLSNRRVETAATRLLGFTSVRRQWLNSVAIQQGLLQVYDDFCLKDASDCTRCPFPEQLAKW